MSLTDNMFVLKKIEKISDKILLYIDLQADDETREVYLSTYFEGLFMGKGTSKYSVYTEIVDNQIVGEILFETIMGLSTAAGDNLQRLWVRARMSDTYVDYAVTMYGLEEVLSFGHKKQFLISSNDGIQFSFASSLKESYGSNPIKDKLDAAKKQDIIVDKVSADAAQLKLSATISQELQSQMEEEAISGELALAWKDTKTKRTYFLHEEQIVDGKIEFTVTRDEVNRFNQIDTDNSILEWLLIDVNGKEHKIYADQNADFGKVILPTNDFYAELIAEADYHLTMKMATTLFFEYVDVCYDGNGIIVSCKRRSYDLEVANVIAQRVNTDIEYCLPCEIISEDENETKYGIRFSFDEDEADFKRGIYQIWVELKDGISIDRYPLRLFREIPIRENTFLIAKQPYTVLGDHYYTCLFYNDGANNLKINIMPKRVKLKVHKTEVVDEKLKWYFTYKQEPYFNSITSMFLLAENGDEIDLVYRMTGDKWRSGITMEVDIPKDIMRGYGINASFVPGIRFEGRTASVAVENNFDIPAVTNRESGGFSLVDKSVEGETRRVWGDLQGGVYKMGITENTNLLKESGMWLFEENKLCIRVDWLPQAVEFEDADLALYLRDLLTGEEQMFDRELAVEDEIIFRTELQNVASREYQIFAKVQGDLITYLEMTSPAMTLLSGCSAKKASLKRSADGSALINVEDMLLFEREDKIEECKAIIERAQAEKAEGKRKVWLVGENYGLSARDNGLAFFEYCMQHKDSVDAEVYFVTKADNEDIAALEQFTDNVVMYDSEDHIYLDELAEMYIVSHGIRDVMPSLYHNAIGTYRKNVVYLQHGVAAIKKFGMSNQSYGSSIRKFVVSSEQERRLLVDNKQFWEDEIIVTGLARYDKLFEVSKSNRDGYIWIMPTWRDWLVKSEKEFLNSDFFIYYSQLLSDEKIISKLRETKKSIVFNLHVEFEKYKPYFAQFENDVIHISDMHEKSITERIRECGMIITDYSSIIFDVVYMDKPAIFFQFDQDVYNKHRGSYVNLETDLPGEVTHTTQELIDAVIKMISTDFAIDEKYADRVNRYFDYKDCNNSQRIYEEIINLREEIADEY